MTQSVNESVNESVTRLFVEQPQPIYTGSVKYYAAKRPSQRKSYGEDLQSVSQNWQGLHFRYVAAVDSFVRHSV